MEITANNWQCNYCSTSFVYDGDPMLANCPSCGSLQLTRFIEIKDEMHVSVAEHVGLVTKDPSLPSKRKRRRELRSGTRSEGNRSGRLVHEYRLSDHDHDHYEEKITDIQSGEVIQQISEPLSVHRNHGSAKKK